MQVTFALQTLVIPLLVEETVINKTAMSQARLPVLPLCSLWLFVFFVTC
jgi:hypothetical protein